MLRKSRFLFGLLFAVPLFWFGCAGGRRPPLGVQNGRLRPCPSSPNCVSTQSDDPARRMEALSWRGAKADAKRRLLEVIASMPRARVVSDEGDYIHAEFRSRLFRFVDDVEFLFDDAKEVIHFRSASRVGHSDLGVNRKRMERIAKAFGPVE